MVYYNMYKDTMEFKKITEEEYSVIWDQYSLLTAYIDLNFEVGTEAYSMVTKSLYNKINNEIGYIPVKLENDNEVGEILETVNKTINKI